MHRLSCPKYNSCRPVHAISAALHKTLYTPVSLPFRDLSNPFSPYRGNCHAPSSGIHSPLAVRQNLPSHAPSGPKFNGNVFTAPPVSRFIFTPSNRFRQLMALTSTPPSKSELAAVSYFCAQPSCHPTEHNSIHRSKISGADVCTFQSSWIYFGFRVFKTWETRFRCSTLMHTFNTLVRTLGSLDFPLDFPCFPSVLPLPKCQGSLSDHYLLCLPLQYDCLPVLLSALQSRWNEHHRT